MNEINSSMKRYLHRLLFLTFWVLVFLNFPNLCNANNKHQHDHHHHHHHEHEESPSYKYSKHANEPYTDEDRMQKRVADESLSVWSQALGSTLLISAAPFFILFFVPLDKSKEKESVLKILLSFASGGLLGDSFLHLIPEALSPHSHGEEESSGEHSHEHKHGHDHSQSHVGFFVLLGIVMFLMVEKGVRLVNTGHSHSHSHNVVNKNTKKENQDKGDFNKKDNSVKESKKGSKKQKQKGVISVSGYLNLAADFTHNLTDGLAIGASYLAGKNIGIITTITILLHEIPHEIGDFAILIQSGCSRRKAMGLQLITALGAIMGTVISLMAEGADSIASSWILPFTAGGFIYISTVSIIPELLEDSNFVQSIKEILAMLFGVFLMIVIADFE